MSSVSRTRTVAVEVTYSGIVTVTADTAAEARRMAERGPSAWLGPMECADHLHTEILGVEALTDDDGTIDAMTAWREHQERS